MATAGFTSGHIDLGGLSFHYTDWGGDGPPLVMLHGLSGHARTWDHTAAALSDRYRVLALDQRGHGDTDWAPQYGIGLMAADLLAFMDALQLREVTLMGLSMGGLVSFVFAAAHPERVRRLMVLDIGPEIAPARDERILRNGRERRLRLRGRSVRPGTRSQPASYRRDAPPPGSA